MKSQKQLFNLFRYPVIVWAIIWLIFFVMHLQISFVFSLLKATLYTFSQFGIFYFVQKVIIPRYFDRHLWKFALLSLLILVSVSVVITYLEYALRTSLSDRPFREPPIIVLFFVQFLFCFIALWVSLSLYIFKKERNTQKEMEQLRAEKTKTELKFLKAQINPHFLFNALNNIYAITYIGDKTAPDKIAMLSNMLRYVIYECESDFVPLEKELEYLNNFIAFQQLKTESEQTIKVNINIDNKNARVAPMILIPFVENAFKYSGIIKDKKGFVELNLKQRESSLTFMVKNSIAVSKAEKYRSKGGIGIENLKNRLELIYKDGFKLLTEKNENEYFVLLKILL